MISEQTDQTDQGQTSDIGQVRAKREWQTFDWGVKLSTFAKRDKGKGISRLDIDIRMDSLYRRICKEFQWQLAFKI